MFYLIICQTIGGQPSRDPEVDLTLKIQVTMVDRNNSNAEHVTKRQNNPAKSENFNSLRDGILTDIELFVCSFYVRFYPSTKVS